MDLINLLYTPLDVPERPAVDIDKFKQWLTAVYPQECLTKTPAWSNSMALYKDKYPWHLTFGMADGEWQNNFDTEFPEYSKYLYESIGLERHEIVSIIFLPVRDHVTGLAFWHADVDDLGFRFYVDNEKYLENPLLLKKTKLPHTRNAMSLPISDNDIRLQPEIYTFKMLSPTQSYYLNNYRAVHSPFINVPGSRISGFVNVYPKYREEVRRRTEAFILQSAAKFKDHTILW